MRHFNKNFFCALLLGLGFLLTSCGFKVDHEVTAKGDIKPIQVEASTDLQEAIQLLGSSLHDGLDQVKSVISRINSSIKSKLSGSGNEKPDPQLPDTPDQSFEVYLTEVNGEFRVVLENNAASYMVVDLTALQLKVNSDTLPMIYTEDQANDYILWIFENSKYQILVFLQPDQTSGVFEGVLEVYNR